MIESLKGRLFTSAVVALIGLVWVAPNVISVEKIWWPTQDKLNFGLDIQGGLHLALGVDIPKALKEKSARTASQIEQGLKFEHDITAKVDVVDTELLQFNVNYSGGSEETVAEYMDYYFANTMQILSTSASVFEIKYQEAALQLFKKGLIDKSKEVLTNRIDQLGVAEPSITSRGDDRLIVQLPGLENAQYAKSVINKTAQLKFMILDTDSMVPQGDENPLQKMVEEAEAEGKFKLGGDDGLTYTKYVQKLNEFLKEKLPKDRVIRFQKDPAAKSMEVGKVPYLLRADAMMSGSTLEDAGTNFDPSTGAPLVSFSLNAKGAKEFGDLTTKYEKGFMAIVLDEVVMSAPRLTEPILGGSGQITMGGSSREESLNEANLLSLVLKSGALPVTLDLLEERKVGPSLGEEAKNSGQRATLIGLVLVLVFMVLYYRAFGAVADIALGVNLILLFAALSSLKATLTLPGIAGIALTVGMAVDANIIIFERVREEILKGTSLAASVRDGFASAFITILDSNVTTILTCVVLMYFGSGPIRGFAVTLSVGLLVSMFTAVFVSRTLLELVVVKWKLKVKI